MLTVNSQRVKCRPPVVVALNRFLQHATWRACADIMRSYGVRVVVPTGLMYEHSCPVSEEHYYRKVLARPLEFEEELERDWAKANHPAYQEAP